MVGSIVDESYSLSKSAGKGSRTATKSLTTSRKSSTRTLTTVTETIATTVTQTITTTVTETTTTTVSETATITSGAITHLGVLPRLYVEKYVIGSQTGPFFLIGCNIRGQAFNPKTNGRYDDWYTYRYSDAANIKSYGFNVIRLIAYWECIETSQSPSEFTYDDEYIEKIRQTVEAYSANNIYVIIDLHQHGSVNELGKFIPTLGCDTDFADEFYSDSSPTSAREHLKQLWLGLSETFKNYSGIAGYDICNEPHRSYGSLSNQQVADCWFDIADYVIDGLRGVGDNHVVFVDFSPWSRYAGFMSRKLNDDNVVYCAHFYQGINATDVTVLYNDYSQLQSAFEKDINAKMAEFNVPFVMEEQGFGGFKINEEDERDIWLRNAITIHKTSSLMQGWLYFCYIAYGGNVKGGGWQATLIKCLADKLSSTRTTNQLTIGASSAKGGLTNQFTWECHWYDSCSSSAVSKTPANGCEFNDPDLRLKSRQAFLSPY